MSKSIAVTLGLSAVLVGMSALASVVAYAFLNVTFWVALEGTTDFRGFLLFMLHVAAFGIGIGGVCILIAESDD